MISQERLERLDNDLDELQRWAKLHATRNTGMFHRTAEAAEVLLELFDLDLIGHSAQEREEVR